MSDTVKQSPLESVLTGGIKRRLAPDERVRLYLLNALLMIGFFILGGFAAQNYLTSNYLVGHIVAGAAGVVLIVFITIRLTKNFAIASYFIPILMFFLYSYLNFIGDKGGASILWGISYPLIAIFLLGAGWGTFFSILFVLVNWGLLFFPELVQAYFPVDRVDLALDLKIRIAGATLLSFAFSIAFESIRGLTQKNLEKSQADLQSSTDELLAEKANTDAIFENVQEGIFLIDQDMIINPKYSQILEDILGWHNLGGKPFLDLLQEKIPEKDLQATQDYLEMFFGRRPNLPLLKEINPLEEITLNLPDPDRGFRAKYLSFNFDLVKEPEPMILASVRDRTAEQELMAKLKEEEAKSARQMKNLFQIIHIKPEMMLQFLEDSSRDLQNINELLKSKENDSRYILEQMYQGIHAVKGNAQLLGLDATVDLSHNIEEKIKDMLERPFQWNFLLQLTVDLSYLQGELNDIKSLIEKIQDFQSDIGPEQKSEDDLIVLSIQNFLKKVREERNLEIHLDSQKFRSAQIPQPYRKIAKEMISQFVRNTVVHGIEPAEEREAQGKTSHGTISLSTEVSQDTFTFTYKDDGRGINGAKIKAAAKANPRFQNLDLDSMSQGQLVGLIFQPGFSTSASADTSSGQGIGMAMVKNRVESQGGKLKIKTAPGKHLQFTITLPIGSAAEHQVLDSVPKLSEE
jgi:two-component system chemotaxis sensor kinase CheA